MEQRPKPNLLQANERGAILVLGLVMAAFLVSIVFHMANVGEAILWRETNQDAADAVAYETALWNARGMNVLSATNIILAIVLAILVAWRLLMLVVTTMVLLAALGCFASFLVPPLAFFCGLTGTLSSLLVRMGRFDTRIQRTVYKVMGGINKGQIVIAGTMPLIATAVPAGRFFNASLGPVNFANPFDGHDQYPDVEWGIGLGFQLAPPGEWLLNPTNLKNAKKWANNEKTSPLGQLPTGPNQCGVKKNPKHMGSKWRAEKRMGIPCSLPAQASEDEMDVMCSKSARWLMVMVSTVADKVGVGDLGLGSLSDDNSKITQVFENITSGLSGVLCEDFKNLPMEKFESLIDEKCEGEAKKEAEKPANKSKSRMAIARMQEARRKKCEKEERAKKDKVDQAKDYNPLREPTYAKPWFYSANGGLFMQTWGFVKAKRPPLNDINELVNMANIFNEGAEAKVELEESAFVVAGAEMFFQCHGPWMDCRELAPWVMGWRARLRRWWPPKKYLAAFGERVVVETFFESFNRGPMAKIADKISSKVKEKLKDAFDGAAGKALSSVGSKVTESIGGAARDEFKNRAKRLSYELNDTHNAAQEVQNLFMDEDEGNDVIH